MNIFSLKKLIVLFLLVFCSVGLAAQASQLTFKVKNKTDDILTLAAVAGLVPETQPGLSALIKPNETGDVTLERGKHGLLRGFISIATQKSRPRKVAYIEIQKSRKGTTILQSQSPRGTQRICIKPRRVILKGKMPVFTVSLPKKDKC